MKVFSPLNAIFMTFTLLVLLVGCKEKTKDKLPYEQSVESLSPTIADHNTTAEQNHTPSAESIFYSQGGKRFRLADHRGGVHEVAVEKDQLLFKDISQPVVILHFFSPWSLPCRGEAPYLTQLQKKYKDKLFIIGILLHPNEHLQELESFIKRYDATYFIATGSENEPFTRNILSTLHIPEILPIPLTVIYQGGHYYRHYEGAVPIEMIEHNIKTILKQ